jgi:hypothetical protein
MTKRLTIELPDDLEQALIEQAVQRRQSPEEVALQVLSEQLIDQSHSQSLPVIEDDPLLRLIGTLSIDIPDLAENHDYYIGQTLYRELDSEE